MSTTTAALSPMSTAGGERAPSQGGILDGSNPTEYNPKDPIIIFIIQAGLIIIICHLLHWPLSKIHQPRVIAEVIGGIILGPSVMGHIPGFRDAIFPSDSIPNLTLVANVGLVLYLFMIGMETDVAFLINHWRPASAVAIGGLALPFGLGCALAWGLYDEFRDDPGIVHIEFSTYMLFIGVAIAITAFPVLCRILTELNLLSSTAGVITLAAGVANDVLGWVLLALCVALANAASGLLALWILLTAAGFILFLILLVRPVLHWFLHYTGNMEHGPSQSSMTLILLIAFTAAFFTGVIGIHPIFGGFIVGLLVPREHGFAIKVTEKLEDLIGALFLPLYFTLSGLNTNLGLLDSGLTWGYVFAVTLTALFSKMIGASVAARFTGLVWRESFTVGTLMSCKGLVELVVLNIGLQAKILSQRTFTIFVVMALLTTFVTTPLTKYLYPPWYQTKIAAWKRGEIDWDSGEALTTADTPIATDAAKPISPLVGQILVYLRLENLPAMLNLVSLFGKAADIASPDEANSDSKGASIVAKGPPATRNAVKAHGLRLLQLGDRDSSVMTVAEVDKYTLTDPVVNTFRTVGQFMRVAVSGEVAVVNEQRFAEALLAKAADISSDFLLIPWSETGNTADSQYEMKFSFPYGSLAKSALASQKQAVAIFVPKGSYSPKPTTPSRERSKPLRAYSFSDIHRDIAPIPVTNRRQNIVMPFLGGDDDRYALGLVLQLCQNPAVVATVVHVTTDGSASDDSHYLDYISSHLPDAVSSRIEFKSVTADNIVETVITQLTSAMRKGTGDTTWHNLTILGRRAASTNGKAPADELQECLGHTAANVVESNIKTDVLAIQAKAEPSF